MRTSISMLSFCISAVTYSQAFSGPSSSKRVNTSLSKLQSYAPSQREYESNYLFDDFRTASGEIINPYDVLNVEKASSRNAIKRQYRTLSKIYHPDGVRFADSLPKNCNNLNDVREEWEKISLAYTILSDKKQRLKYDRHSALDNFGSAMAWGIGGLTNGLTTAAKSIINTIEEGQKMSMKIEHSVSEIKVQVRHMEVGQKQRKNDMKSSTSMTNENVKRCKTDAIPASTYGALAHKNFIVPKPKNSKYYSPFEACSIIHEHEKNPALNKPQAMRVMLENEYVPVKRAQLYLLLNKFKEGSLSETREWGRVGRPQNLAP